MPNINELSIPDLPPTLDGFIEFVKRSDAYPYAVNHRTEVNVWLLEDDILNGQDALGNMPLHHAVRHGNLEMVWYLVDHGANLNACNNNDETPLAIASVCKNDVFIVNCLIEKGADTTILDHDEASPLFLMADELLYELMNSDSINENEINQSILGLQNLALKTPRKIIDESCFLNYPESVLAFLSDEIKDNPLLRKIYENHPAIEERFHELLEGMAPVAPQQFFIAAYQGRVNCVKRYLSDHVNDLDKINTKDEEGGFDALICAAGNNQLYVAKLLCEAGINLDTFDAQGYSALMYAIDRNYVEMVGYLMSRMSWKQVTACRVDGLTALSLVQRSKSAVVHDAVFRRVYEGERRVTFNNHRDHEGKTILHHVVSMSGFTNARNQFPKQLTQSQAIFFSRSFIELFPSAMNKIKSLLEGGISIDVRDYAGNTPLMLSAATPFHLITSGLITSGASVNAVNNRGETALMLAARAGAYETVNMLVAAGADPSLKNVNGHAACDMTRQSRILKILNSGGRSDTQKRDNAGEGSPAKRVKRG